MASQIPHAVGVAYGMAYRQDDLVALTFFGDGATSEGDFHEALNFAEVFPAPVVFVCQNNQWAISMPRDRQTASKTLAQYTHPQVAWCGIDEPTARERDMDVEVLTFPWNASGRAVTMDETDGLTKLICDAASGRILGAGIVRQEAEALISEAVLAIEMGACAEDLASSIHPHPTLSESLAEASETFAGSATHLAR